MANRAYVYSSNVIPVPGSSVRKIRAKGITESNYGINIAVGCFIGAKIIKPASSIIFDDMAMNVVSDYEQGSSLFLKFLERAASLNVKDMDKRKLEVAQRFLGRYKGRFFIGEFGELAEMDVDIDMEENKEKFFKVLNKRTKKLYIPQCKKLAEATQKALKSDDNKFRSFVQYIDREELLGYYLSDELYFM